jgi:hypothetical protein
MGILLLLDVLLLDVPCYSAVLSAALGILLPLVTPRLDSC